MTTAHLNSIRELPPSLRSRSLPLTFNQEKYFLREAMRGDLPDGSPQFHVVLGYQSASEIDRDILECSLRQMIRRHTVLRTGFFQSAHGAADRERAIEEFAGAKLVSSGIHCQAVLEAAGLSFAVQDLRRATGSDPASLAGIVKHEIATPFDLADPPLMRASLIRLGDGNQMVLITVHHLIFDHWSSLLFCTELEELYVSAKQDRECLLPRLSSQFGDFAQWQHKYLAGSGSTADIRFWCDTWLRAESTQFEFADFPFALQRPNVTQATYSKEVVRLDAGLGASIRTFALQAKCTLYMFFMAALAIALRHCTNKDRIFLWTNFANRSRPGTRDLLGWFVNSHPAGLDLPSSLTAIELIRHAREIMLAAMRHQAMPLLFALRHLSSPPKFSGLRIILEGIDLARTEKLKLPLQSESAKMFEGPVNIPYAGGDARHTLRLVFVDYGSHIDLSATYSPRRFGSASITGLLDAIREIAGAVIATPDLEVSCFARPIELAMARK